MQEETHPITCSVCNITDSKRLACAGPQTSVNRPPVTEEISLNDHRFNCLLDPGLNVNCVIAKWLVTPGQLIELRVEMNGAMKSSPTLTLPIARRMHIDSKYVTEIISASGMTDPIYPVLLGNRYVYLGCYPNLLLSLQGRLSHRSGLILHQRPGNPVRLDLRHDKPREDNFGMQPRTNHAPSYGIQSSVQYAKCMTTDFQA